LNSIREHPDSEAEVSRNLLYVIVALAVLLLGYFLFFAGGAQDVAETAGEAAQTAADAATEAAGAATEAATDAANATANAASEAVSAATDAATDAANATAEAATDVANAATDAATDAAASVTSLLSGAGLDLSQAFNGLNLQGFDAALLDPATYNLDNLMNALGTAGLSAEAATGLRDVLTKASETPALLAEVLNQIKTALGL
jgi:cytoskeletal protein RodZ